MPSYNEWLKQQAQVANPMSGFSVMGVMPTVPQVSMFNQGGAFPTAQGTGMADNSSMFGGTGWNPSEGFNFTARQPGQSAGVPGMSDYLQGAGKSFGEGDFMGGFGSLADGAGSMFKDSGFLGKTENGIKSDGWGSLALGAASGLMNGYMGMKQYGLAKETLANNKAQFERNFGAQAKMTNSALEDRQNRRVADATANGNAGSVRSTKDYMSQYGVV